MLTIEKVQHLLNRLEMNLVHIGRFVRFLFKRFVEDQGLPNAASLTYTTLLSLVPLMTVSLAIFAAFPVSDRVAEQIQNFVFRNFVPASGELLQQYLQQFSQKASRLTGAGFIFLIIVALIMMANIDRAFNTIWRVQRKRGSLSMFIIYWSILSLGPLLIGISMAVTSYLVSIPLFSNTVETLGLKARLIGLMPILASAVAFTLLYAIVPNRKVPFRHALIGGFLAATLFELAKRGFVLYLTSFPTYQAIYGALAVIPIFLVWIYLSWVVILLGAEFSYCLGIFNDVLIDRGRERGQGFLLAFRILRELWLAQKSGSALSFSQLSDLMARVSDQRLEELLEQMREAKVVYRTEEGNWGLARRLSDLTLLDLFYLQPFALPESRWLQDADEPAEQALGSILKEVEQGLARAMDNSLHSIYSGNVNFEPRKSS